ncbi:MAG: cyclomaltodextrinase N-terminal domain-containing protein, partial [Bacteroidales bacterium]|nr:cyclomaltodextrinase N-terminal domain-containing protein [Bacteroidales bacterium]
MRKRFLTFNFLFLILLTFSLNLQAQKKNTDIKIEPPFWWTGMQNKTLQLMVYGQNIGETRVTIDYPGVKTIR